MIIDNFDQIRGILDFSNPDLFYFIQIIKRKKDNNPETTKSSKLIKSYYIFNLQHLNHAEEEMKLIATLFNARIYISVNQKSKENVFKKALILMSEKNAMNNFDFTGIFNSVVGKDIYTPTKKYLVDVDTKDETLINELTNYINNKVFPITDNSKIIHIISTINGCHFICKPCRLGDLTGIYDESLVSYNTNASTLLYYNDNKKC